VLHTHHQTTAYVRALDDERRLPRRRPATGDPVDLLRRAQGGDDEAWAELHARHSNRIRGIARSFRLGAHDVEDVLQSTWLRLYLHVGSVRQPEALGGWLDTTARREALRIVQAAERVQPSDDERLLDAAVEPVDERRLVSAEDREALRAALARLNARQKALLMLLFTAEEPSYAEIARILGVPIGCLGPTRARGLDRLRVDRVLATALDRG
jgi:RNA polymerase sigma factor (sigma-70 family)